MLIHNVLAVFQILNIPNNKTHNQDTLFVFIPNISSPSLLYDELYADENIKENCKKNIWKTFKKDKFLFTKHSFYDDIVLNNETRIFQCASSCILKDNIDINENWFSVNFKKDEILLSNGITEFNFKYKIINNEMFIISSNVLFLNNHSKILLEILFDLKHLFNHTNMAFSISEDKNPVKITSIINTFNHRNVAISTINKRFKSFF